MSSHMSITIRHSEKSDFEAIRDIYAQPSCYSNTLQLPFPSKDKWEQRLNDAPTNFYSLVAISDQKIVGQLGMQTQLNPRRSHVANFGMGVDESCRNKGVGTKLLKEALDMADNWLAITRIDLEVYTDNLVAKSLYEKFGFEVEGTARSYAFRNGQYADVFLMARVLPL